VHQGCPPGPLPPPRPGPSSLLPWSHRDPALAPTLPGANTRSPLPLLSPVAALEWLDSVPGPSPLRRPPGAPHPSAPPSAAAGGTAGSPAPTGAASWPRNPPAQGPPPLIVPHAPRPPSGGPKAWCRRRARQVWYTPGREGQGCACSKWGRASPWGRGFVPRRAPGQPL